MLYSLLAPIMLQVVTIAMDIATNFIKGGGIYNIALFTQSKYIQ